MHYNLVNKYLKNMAVVLQYLGEVEHSAALSEDYKVLMRVRLAMEEVRHIKDALMKHEYEVHGVRGKPKEKKE